MKSNLTLALVLSTVLSTSAFAGQSNQPLPLGGRSSIPASLNGDVDDYQIGDVWGKTPVKAGDLRTASDTFRKAVRATAKYSSLFGGATGFYMGKFNGEHIMGTNHHVVDGLGCRGVTLAFPFLVDGKTTKVKCKRIIGHWTDIDFGLIVLDIPSSLEKAFDGAGVNFAYDKKLETGTKLLTVGFGIAFNANQKDLMVNQDNDCKVYSGTDDFRFMGDPDTINPGPYKAWSFAHGCDISHGDSGSAFFNRDTGDMVGIVWTAATPKDPQIRTRAYLDSLKPGDEAIWTKLGYTVPASKIGEYLKGTVLPSLGKDDAAIVEALLK